MRNSDAKERERMQGIAREHHSERLIFQGEIKDIPLKQGWYCPHCTGREIVQLHLTSLNSYQGGHLDEEDRLMLVCPSHHEVCEYTFLNAVARAAVRCCWFEGYKYPLSYREAIETQIKYRKNQINSCEQLVKSNLAEIKKHEFEVIELQAKLLDIPTDRVTS